MRGKRCTWFSLSRPVRNIPAHAGKTMYSFCPHHLQPEHPRACGENCHDLWGWCGLAGTSPRMRGKLRVAGIEQGPLRNIPAHAGKTVGAGGGDLRCPEHPRACGENGLTLSTLRSNLGTSPRMRGKPRTTIPTNCARGNIPAHAGKTGPSGTNPFDWSEHPRACGENVIVCYATGCILGTSPRMRGKQQLVSYTVRFDRNIPAHAGKTIIMLEQFKSLTEHPRACGENCGRGVVGMIFSGTSPRMRGKQGACCAVAVVFEEHPRACGENGLSRKLVVRRIGTSPRMRGKQRRRRARKCPRRNIPAHAGKTHGAVGVCGT